MVDLSKTANEGVAALKTVTVFSTLGKNAQEFKSQANTWADLQKELSELKINYSGMKAVIGETRLTVEHPNATVPATNFSLYLMPIKTKSGMADRKELFVTIKAIVTKNPDAKSHFIVDGKNMTQLATPKLEELLASYSNAAHGAKVNVAPVEGPKKTEPKAATSNSEVEEYVQDIKDLLDDDDVYETKNRDVLAKVRDIISLLSANSVTEVKQKAESKVHIETAEQKLVRKAKEKQEKLNAKMAKEANDMMSGFSDVKR